MNQQKMNDIKTVVSKMGQNVVAGTQYDMIQVWKSWYRGNVNNFHRYQAKTVNGKTVNREKLTFGLPKKIGEDWSSLLWNENVYLGTTEDDYNERLSQVLDDNNFKVELGNLIEKTFGYSGMSATVEYLIDDETVIDYINGELMMITEGKGTTATGLVTINEIELSNAFLTHLTMHTLEDGKYIVEHQAYVSKKQSELGSQSRQALTNIFTAETLSQMEEEVYDDQGNLVRIRYVVIYDTDIATFQVYRPNITNNYDTQSKDGIPVTANAIDSFKALDNAYDALDNETRNNKTVTVFSDKATKKRSTTDTETGETSYINYVDDKETRFISVPLSDNEDWVKHFKGEFTAEPYIATINRHLSWISFKVGLGTGYYSFDGTNTYVNEKQIISTNNDTWKNKVKHEILLRESLEGLIRAVIFLEQSRGRLTVKDYDVVIKFDDSIIQDDEALKENSLKLVSDGFKPAWRHLVEWEGLTEAEAKEWIAERQEEDNAVNQNFFSAITPEEE